MYGIVKLRVVLIQLLHCRNALTFVLPREFLCDNTTIQGRSVLITLLGNYPTTERTVTSPVTVRDLVNRYLGHRQSKCQFIEGW